MTKYQYAGLTPELHQRLVNERVALKLAHLRDYKQHFQKVRQCSEKQAIIILQALNSAVVERARISPQTVDRLKGIISDGLFNDLQDYLENHYTMGKTTRPVLEKTNAGLLSEIADFVFNNYEWSERLDDDADRIMLEYHTKGKTGMDKIAVRKALYKAYSLGV